MSKGGSVRTQIGVTLVGLLVAGSVLADSPPEQAPSITPSELQARRDGGDAPTVIDVRSAEEYAAGHIPGAVNIPFDQIVERIGSVPTPHGVALYCLVGPRARKGEAALLASGFERVLHIEGGLTAWQESGLPVERAP
jgi:rhodanese-related sulfurtransferase